ncbi:autotransporter outer membrane beta-barrel domain-containing protein [Aminobacter niigataensis]|uniref:autotransporter outer membrane beta-barrel domain-containing protein n=1 Tax=Aminobacter niigataensis TaxID=83265 RepID=UPI0024C7600F|nr:autotransporter outer membrane beta-barrel domain-containing protein [Aminobacter niigataensis]CAI2933734.1 Autotransporter domain-containing protein [Aminobacter niigataensis]
MKLLGASLGASVSVAAIALGIAPAGAGQSTIDFEICTFENCEGWSGAYAGVGFDNAYRGTGYAGAVKQTSSADIDNAYAHWGVIYGAATNDYHINTVTAYGSEFNGLDASRQTQSYTGVPGLPANSVRWFDSFTNNTGDTITANIVFSGTLAAGDDMYVHATESGYVVTGQFEPGNESLSPVIAHLYGNNDYAFNQAAAYYANHDDSPYIVFPVTVAAGQTVSIMNVNLLFGEIGRNIDSDGALYAADVALAIQQSELFINSPIFAGLTAAQVQSLLNWTVKDTGLVAAGGSVALSQRLHEAYDLMLARGTGSTGGQATAQLATGALQYTEEGKAGSDGAAALARSIGDAGGNVALAGFDGSRSFLFGGYTTGSQDFTAGQLDFSGYVTGLGIEHAISPDLLVGLAGGYASGDGDIEGVYANLENRQFTASPYVRWQAPTGTVFDGRLSASTERWQYARTAGAGTASAEIDGYSLGAHLRASHDVELEAAKITPFASLTYLRTHVDSYIETGAGAGNLVVQSYDVDRLEALAGIGASRSWQLATGTSLRGFGSVGIGGAFLGNDETVSTRYTTAATAFLSQAETGEGTFGRVEAGLAADFTNRLSLTSSYAGSFGADRDQHTFNLGLAGKL